MRGLRINKLTGIPAVDLDAATALQQREDVGICGGAAVELVFLQVGVVARVDEVVGQWLVHVLGERRRGRERRKGGEGGGGEGREDRGEGEGERRGGSGGEKKGRERRRGRNKWVTLFGYTELAVHCRIHSYLVNFVVFDIDSRVILTSQEARGGIQHHIMLAATNRQTDKQTHTLIPEKASIRQKLRDNLEIRWLVLGHKLFEHPVVVVMVKDKLMNLMLGTPPWVPLWGGGGGRFWKMT